MRRHKLPHFIMETIEVNVSLLLDQYVLENLNFKCFILQQVMFSAELVEPGVFYNTLRPFLSG
jgi:hypothetical protein